MEGEKALRIQTTQNPCHILNAPFVPGSFVLLSIIGGQKGKRKKRD